MLALTKDTDTTTDTDITTDADSTTDTDTDTTTNPNPLRFLKSRGSLVEAKPPTSDLDGTGC